MRCLGRNKDFKRCKSRGTPFACRHHRLQVLTFFISSFLAIVTIVGTMASLSIFQKISELFEATTLPTETITINIGILLPENEYYGRKLFNGIKLAKKEFQAEHKDVVINFCCENDYSNVDSTITGFDRLLKENVVAIIGSADSHCAYESIELANKNKIPFLTPLATAQFDLSKNEYFFRAVMTDVAMIEELISWMVAKYPHKIYPIIHEDQLFGKSAHDVAKKILINKNYSSYPIQYCRDTAVDSIDMAVELILTDLKNYQKAHGRPEAIAIVGRSTETVLIVEAIKKIYPKIPLFAQFPDYHFYNKRLDIEEYYTVCAHINEYYLMINYENIDILSERLRKFVAAYKSEYRDEETPDKHGAYGYDCGNVLFDAILRAKYKNIKNFKEENMQKIRNNIREEILLTPESRRGIMTDGGFDNYKFSNSSVPKLTYSNRRLIIRSEE